MADKWRSWDEIEAEAMAAGRIDEAAVSAHQDRLRARQRAYRLAEIRRGRGLTQTEVAAEMKVSQKRVTGCTGCAAAGTETQFRKPAAAATRPAPRTMGPATRQRTLTAATPPRSPRTTRGRCGCLLA
jgi:hypothetical protein